MGWWCRWSAPRSSGSRSGTGHDEDRSTAARALRPRPLTGALSLACTPPLRALHGWRAAAPHATQSCRNEIGPRSEGSAMDLRDKKVLITGAASGIGYAIAHALARQGALLALAARNAERLEHLADEIATAGHARPV